MEKLKSFEHSMDSSVKRQFNKEIGGLMKKSNETRARL